MDFSPHAADFVAHYDGVRGRVRLALVVEQLASVLDRPSSVLDVGGGAGHVAVRLAAAGHSVVVVEPSSAMREAAADVVDPDLVGDRVRVEQGAASDVPSRRDAGSFDVVLCHAVAPYVEDLEPLVADVVAGVRPGGMVSLLVKNRDALAMRPALERRWRDVPAAVDADGDAGGLGVRNRAHSLAEVTSALARHDCAVWRWWGIRVVSDVLPPDADEDVDAVLAAERALAARDPYRRLGRLLHVVGQHVGA